eukprot:gnl/TRDRNA2_/TRDRNA2_121975_c1_seq1.p1 gnl/TRDRNA2_/TRDRNA2_121975_c1~~gnl/TRDRNA2_/TRDRNA2_121975_c1_seq1.p1  ORF type:complete len:450 (+),score=56.74 gnl/TRDRNA2_/TRDRNA2_121975_c1_seq1:181-1350(+)
MTAAQHVNSHVEDDSMVDRVKHLMLIHDILYGVEDGAATDSGSHVLTRKDFLSIWKERPLLCRELHDLLELPRLCSGEEAFDLLDPGNDQVDAAAFLISTFRHSDRNNFHEHVQTLISIHRLETKVSHMMDEVQQLLLRIQARSRSRAASSIVSPDRAAGGGHSFEDKVAQMVSQMIEDRMQKVEDCISNRIENTLVSLMLPTDILSSSPSNLPAVDDVEGRFCGSVQDAVEKTLEPLERTEGVVEARLASVSYMPPLLQREATAEPKQPMLMDERCDSRSELPEPEPFLATTALASPESIDHMPVAVEEPIDSNELCDTENLREIGVDGQTYMTSYSIHANGSQEETERADFRQCVRADWFACADRDQPGPDGRNRYNCTPVCGAIWD